ncbi:nucleotidyltransferase domain-containing protein [Lactococcus garvieae]|uniref:nucleotidyltransferase domain-containing protein n=2 Tax=Lactococcus garvieae TaxID=1363 RepID=UPI003854DECF
MAISMNLSTKDNAIHRIMSHIKLFHSFENIYLFGSVLDEKNTPNDIDLLLIYKNFSSKLLVELDILNVTFEEIHGLSFDFTVLSEYESEELDFITRLNSNYLKLK